MKTGIAYNYYYRVNKFLRKGVPAPSYPKVYNLLDAFKTYPALSEHELAGLPVSFIEERAKAFKNYIQEMEGNEIPDNNQCIVYAPEHCPIHSLLKLSMYAQTDSAGKDPGIVTTFAVGSYSENFQVPQTVAAGSQIVCKTSESNEHYDFEGWYDNEQPALCLSTNKEYSFEIEKNTILLARWRAIKADILLVLIKGSNILRMEGGGNYKYNDLVSIKAIPQEDCDFTGWFKNGVLLSTSASYSFRIIENMELEARAVNSANYEFSAQKQILQLPFQGGTLKCLITSKKNGSAQTFRVDTSTIPSWLELTPTSGTNTTELSFKAGFNVGELKSAIIKLVQDGSSKELLINVEQLKSVPVVFQWKLNDSDYMNWRETSRDIFVFDLENPYAAKPSRPCTMEDYVQGITIDRRTYKAEELVNGEFIGRELLFVFFFEAIMIEK